MPRVGAQSPTPSGPTVIVDGRLLDFYVGLPVVGRGVRLNAYTRDPMPAGTTDAQGHFVLTAPNPTEEVLRWAGSLR